jgi:hypothetical protein
MPSLRLPNKEKAYIPRHKILDYLLSEKHAVGKSKARFFRSLGFDESNAGELEQGLLGIAQTEAIKESVASPHGTKYVIDGFLKTPQGVEVRIRTIWIIEVGHQAPRFVTAYPVE